MRADDQRVSVHPVALVLLRTLVATKARGECQHVGLAPSTIPCIYIL